MDWGRLFWALWSNHRGKTIGIGIGFIFGLMVVVLGFFEALFISLCMFIGYFIGKRIDENVNFSDLMDKMFRDH